MMKRYRILAGCGLVAAVLMLILNIAKYANNVITDVALVLFALLFAILIIWAPKKNEGPDDIQDLSQGENTGESHQDVQSATGGVDMQIGLASSIGAADKKTGTISDIDNLENKAKNKPDNKQSIGVTEPLKVMGTGTSIESLKTLGTGTGTEPQQETEGIAADEMIKVKEFSEYKRKLSHSMRMPIAIMTGYGNLIEQGKCTPEEEKTYIHKICQNVKYLDLNYKMLLEEMPEEEVIFDVGKLVDDFVDQIAGHIEKKNKKIMANRTKDLIRMRGNPMEITKVLYNLTDNSLKYMDEGKEIYITVDHINDTVLLIYRDDGSGVRTEDVDLLTKKEYQGSNAEKSPGSGTGYGLYMIKRIVEKWQGSLQIKSSEGKGFAVYMNFPEYKE